MAKKKSDSLNGDVVIKAKRTRKTVKRDSPAQRSSIYRGVTRYGFLFELLCECVIMWLVLEIEFWWMWCEDIDGPDVMKLICGIRIVGMNRRTKKDDKVISFSNLFECSCSFINKMYQMIKCSWILIERDFLFMFVHSSINMFMNDSWTVTNKCSWTWTTQTNVYGYRK